VSTHQINKGKPKGTVLGQLTRELYDYTPYSLNYSATIRRWED
jgi:hypothetical protein